MVRSTVAKRLVVASLVCLGLAAQASPANAAPTTSESVPTMVVLDASGSMLNNDAPGLRIDAAKQAVHGLVDRLPGEAQLGLQVYGTSTGSNDAEKAAGCQDVTTLVPVGPVDKGAFLSAVDGVNASGYTPIGTALREAVKALPAEGPRAIVLVSDGIDTCAPPPPCDVARELAAEDGLDLTVHTVGFLVDAEARADLQCIAEATGGTYADANNAEQLDQALQHKVEYAITGYQVEGIPVVGTDTRDDPSIPLLTPGQYTDTLPAQADSKSEVRRYYKIDPPEGWTPRVSVVGVLPAEAGKGNGDITLILEARNAKLTECGRDFTAKGAESTDPREPVVVAAKITCEGESVLTVIRTGPFHADQEMDLELVVRFEPPADASGVPRPETRPVPDAPARSTEVLPIAGGSSFNNAVEITSAQTYSSTVQDGEYLYFKVPMTWGQQLAFRFDATTREGDRDEMLTAEVNLYDPMRNLDSDLRQYKFWYGEGGKESLPVIGGTDEPVRYTSSAYPLDGYYYVVMNLTDYHISGEVRQNFEFTVETSGEIEPGPIYLTDGATPSAKPSASSSSTPSSSAPSADAAPVENEKQPAGTTIVPWLIGGIVVVGAAGGAAILIVRRGRS